MKKWSKEKKRGVTVILVMVAIVCLLAGILINTILNREPENEPAPDIVQLEQGSSPTPAAVEAAEQQAQTVLPGDTVMWQNRFSQCGHMLKCDAPMDITGLTEEEVLTASGDYKILSFANNYICLERMIEGYCPAHMVLYLLDGEICVLQRDADSLENESLFTYPIQTEGIDSLLKQELMAGVVIQDLNEVDAYLEGLDS